MIRSWSSERKRRQEKDRATAREVKKDKRPSVVMVAPAYPHVKPETGSSSKRSRAPRASSGLPTKASTPTVFPTIFLIKKLGDYYVRFLLTAQDLDPRVDNSELVLPGQISPAGGNSLLP